MSARVDDTPEGRLARLDASLSRRGETVIIRRYTATSGTPRPKIDIEVMASVRAIRAEELIGSIDMTASVVVVSPTGLADLLPLKKGDKCVIQGRERNIELPRPIVIGNALARINLMVTG